MTALTKLSLTQFRNHAALALPLDGTAVCLHGPNGAGKTNILEALSLLGPGRGLRAAALTELCNTGSDADWAVSATLDDERKVGVGLDRSGRAAKRIVRIDGAPASPSALAESVRLIWLTPAMDGVFRGGATDRRRFFDRQVMAHRPSHGRISSQYEKAMRERNALLERDYVDAAWAEAIESRMAEFGAEIAINRAHILSRLQQAVNDRPEGPFPKGDLALVGSAEEAAADGKGLEDIQDLLRETFEQSRPKDRAAGRTLIGPHRSDLSVIHRPTGVAADLASTGQQKALLIGLILANARALNQAGNEATPLVLLDEAAAHLDRHRRAALFDELSSLEGQAWLTGTESFLFEDFADRAQLVEIVPSEPEKT